MKPSNLHATSLMVALLSDLLQRALKTNGLHELRAWRQGHENEWMREETARCDYRLIPPNYVTAHNC